MTTAMERAERAGEPEGSARPARVELLLGMALGISLAARAGVERQELNGMVDATLGQIAAWRPFA